MLLLYTISIHSLDKLANMVVLIWFGFWLIISLLWQFFRMADPDLLDYNMDYLTVDEDQYRTVTSLSSYISRGSVDNLDEVSSRVTGGILKFEFEAGGCEEVRLMTKIYTF